MNENTSEIVRTTPEVRNSGYLAQRGLLKNAIDVFAPCGCVLKAFKTGDTVLTPCGRDGCDFSWAPAYGAIKDLEAMETP